SEEERPEAVRETGEAGEEAPHRQAAADEVFANGAIGEVSEGDAEEGVEDDEGGGAEQRQLQIGEGHLLLDGREEDVDEGAVEKVEDVDGGEDRQRVPGVGGDSL